MAEGDGAHTGPHARDSFRLTVQHTPSRFTDSFRTTMPTTTTTVTASADNGATSTVTTTASSPVFPGATKWAAMRSGVVTAPVADVAAFLEFKGALEKIALVFFVDAEVTYGNFDIAIVVDQFPTHFSALCHPTRKMFRSGYALLPRRHSAPSRQAVARPCAPLRDARYTVPWLLIILFY